MMVRVPSNGGITSIPQKGSSLVRCGTAPWAKCLRDRRPPPKSRYTANATLPESLEFSHDFRHRRVVQDRARPIG